MLVVRQVFTVSLPDLVERWEVDRNAAGVALQRITGRMVAILVPAALLSVVLLDPVLPLIAGEDFAGAATAFVPALALLPLLPIPVLGWQTVTLGLRPELALKVNAIGLLAFAAAAGALVPVWDGAGATTALLVAVGVTAVLTLWKLPSTVTPRLVAVATAGAILVLTLGLLVNS
jgi:O-antigen/teichoic acid export membrane protein